MEFHDDSAKLYRNFMDPHASPWGYYGLRIIQVTYAACMYSAALNTAISPPENRQCLYCLLLYYSVVRVMSN